MPAGGADGNTIPQRSGVDVGFSDTQFLRRVLNQAQKGAGSDSAAVKRLEGHGFAPDVARIALHVSGGDEQQALQLCMSGLSFTNGGAFGNGDLLSPEKVCPPPAPLLCYICGGSYLSDKSLSIHTKACRRRFEQREAKRDPKLRRKLLEEHELPEGVSTVEQYYELAGSQPLKAPDTVDTRAKKSFDDLVTRQQQQQDSTLIPCEYCKRTFSHDRIEKHQLVCQERPLYTPSKVKRPPPRKSGGGLTNGIAAGEKAYDNFCQNLERCPGCARQFRKELLEDHLKKCSALINDVQKTPPKTPQRRARSIPGSQRSQPAAGPQSVAGPQSLAGPQARSKAFAPQPRKTGGRTGAAASATVPAIVPSASSAVDEALRSAGAMMQRGFVVRASAEEEAMLEAQLLDSLPSAEFVAAYEVTVGSQHRIYEALKSSMEELRNPDSEISAAIELQLWHGTSWAILAKILQHGFNRSFAGRHGTLLGMATYFSSKLAYSARFCDKEGGGTDKTKVALLSRVLVGKYCKGTPTDVEPPVLDAETGERYDSTVDNESNPSIFAVFKDFQALPVFLLEFRS